MMKTEQLLTKVPPRLVLDHYWNVLDIIDSRLFFDLDSFLRGEEYQRKEEFTASDITVFLSKEIQRSDISPLYRRLCLRSQEIIPEITSKLLSLGLLVKQDNLYRKCDEYSELHRIIKNKMRSAKKLLAWSAWHLSLGKPASFTLHELLPELSYQEEDYIEEIQHLQVFVEKRWLNLLEKHDGGWLLSQEPQFPKKPVLLMNLQDRLHVAIASLSKQGDKFRTEEILSKIRELEATSIRKLAKSIGLIQQQEKWCVDQSTLDSIKGIVLGEAKKRPFYGIIIVRNPYFKLLGTQSRTLYVDIPNSYLFSLVKQFQDVAHSYRDNPKEMLKQTRELANIENRKLARKWGKWISFNIRKNAFLNKPFGLRINIDWKEFDSFIKDFSQRSLSLKDKYEYMLNCRALSLTLVMRGELERTQADVKEICTDEIMEINNHVNNLVEALKKIKDYLYNISRTRKTIPREPSTLQYLPEMISTVRTLGFIVEHGTLPACYREMRKVLENLSWMMFDDLLFYKTSILKTPQRDEIDIPNPYGLISREWYNWARGTNCFIKDLSELKDSMSPLVDSISSYSQRQRKNWSEQQIQQALFRLLASSLFLLLVGKTTKVDMKARRHVLTWEVNKLLPLAKEELRAVLKELGEDTPDALWIDNIIMHLARKFSSNEVVAPYPTNEFVMGFTSKILRNETLKIKYDEYSHFVHSYFTSWHIFPFSSVLEFKVFNYEFSMFADCAQQLLDTYLKELFD